MAEPFYFCTEYTQVELLGRNAKNLVELLQGIKEVPYSSIYYHTHRFLQQHHYLSPEPPNDFAYWIINILQEDILGEKIASVDIVQFKTIEELRAKFIELIECFLNEEMRLRNCPEGEEFHFMSCRTFILPTHQSAGNLYEFYEVLKNISIDSLYFHIFEARLRLKKKDNDFSRWLRDIGEKKISEEISKLDPYTYTLEGLREKIISLIV